MTSRPARASDGSVLTCSVSRSSSGCAKPNSRVVGDHHEQRAGAPGGIDRDPFQWPCGSSCRSSGSESTVPGAYRATSVRTSGSAATVARDGEGALAVGVVQAFAADVAEYGKKRHRESA